MSTEVINTDINKEVKQNPFNKFSNSYWAFIAFVGSMFLVTIVNLIMYGVGVTSVDTIWWGSVSAGGQLGFIGWTEILIAGIGSMLTFWGVIWTLRFDKRFITPLVLGETLIVIDALILGWTFTAISYVLMISSAIYNYIMWNKEDDNDSKMNLFNWTIVGIFVLMYVSIGLIGTDLISGELTIINYNDVISSGVVAASWYVVLRKSKWGFVTFIITDLLYFITYCSVGVYATGCSYIIYLFIDSTSFLSWVSTN